MFHSLYTAASGMTAQQTNLDNIANNLANSSTAGFPLSPDSVPGHDLSEHGDSRHGGNAADHGGVGITESVLGPSREYPRWCRPRATSAALATRSIWRFKAKASFR